MPHPDGRGLHSAPFRPQAPDRSAGKGGAAAGQDDLYGNAEGAASGRQAS